MPEYMTSVSESAELTLGQVILLLSQEHDEKAVIELTRKYCLQSSSTIIQKQGMEFLYINGFYEDLNLLIVKNQLSNNISNKLWAEVYQIILDLRSRKYTMGELRQHLRGIKHSDPELQCLIELAIVDTYFYQMDFGKIGNFLDKQADLFDAIQDTYLLSSFNLRIYQKLFIYYWKRNELIMARKYAFRALNQTNSPSTKASLHIHLGLTYTFDTYYQGMYHLKEGLKIAKQYDLKRYIRSIENSNVPFLAAHFGRTEGIETEDISELAHLEIAKGNNEKAIELLEDIYTDSPFKMYYMGLAKQDKNLLSESCKMFVERSDYFFSRLPITAIKNLQA
ncbi:AimR family lysis-lysogeny pheromone receptor [Ornithinibacillus californiensis]|uniref:AimR family lysis-lysogeny pheromone receptor n=1 Tax=Ornithinibacillus californiensis TaxID=161536 RepID=UPI001F34A2AA|nr:AimR family lysis-lysogeny pheromone receptor [Ornithinibacillus californiensis]